MEQTAKEISINEKKKNPESMVYFHENNEWPLVGSVWNMWKKVIKRTVASQFLVTSKQSEFW